MFKLQIRTKNAAFDGEPRAEIARILHDLADSLRNGADTYYVQDSNGNTVGHAEINKRRKNPRRLNPIAKRPGGAA